MNAIRLEVYRHLFASIAEEMGVALMRSAFSPNIKERRDFSCAVFDASGEMVAQAAHIPVHLGSTALSVEAAISACSPGRGEHVILNDPFAGGTHLPDITLVTPVFDRHGAVRFYVANRAHHADVGGITAGSLPLSKHIDEEGIRIAPQLLTDEIAEKLCSASRTPDERRGDLLAQVAANRRGVQRLEAELGKTGPAELQGFARNLLDYSETFMGKVLHELPDGTWSFEDQMDSDGHGRGPFLIRCQLTKTGPKVSFDFRGTHPQVEGPINVPKAVTISAVLYAVRCLAPIELPSNGGYMRCVSVTTESGSLVDANYPAPVAIGNVETSQRITDVVLGALAKAIPDKIPAASCGSMNNVTIGGIDPRTGLPFAYYETIAGGAGAGPSFHGKSAIHTHMTNTWNTPVEALEHAYPFRVSEYRVRAGSGGAGRWRGGDGVQRCYAFESEVEITLLTERRISAPYGASGGHDGKPGAGYSLHKGVRSKLPDKVSYPAQAKDELHIHTPGGGGYGPSETD